MTPLRQHGTGTGVGFASHVSCRCNCKHRGGSWLWRTRSRKSSLWLLGMPRGFGDLGIGIFVTLRIFCGWIFLKLASGFRWKAGWHGIFVHLLPNFFLSDLVVSNLRALEKTQTKLQKFYNWTWFSQTLEFPKKRTQQKNRELRVTTMDFCCRKRGPPVDFLEQQRDSLDSASPLYKSFATMGFGWLSKFVVVVCSNQKVPVNLNRPHPSSNPKIGLFGFGWIYDGSNDLFFYRFTRRKKSVFGIFFPLNPLRGWKMIKPFSPWKGCVCLITFLLG